MFESENEGNIHISTIHSSETCQSISSSSQNIRTQENNTPQSSLEEKISCRKCSFEFVNISYLDIHMENEHGKNNKIKCAWCTFKADTAEALKEHEIVHSEITCTKCDRVFKDINEVNQHDQIHHQQPEVRIQNSYAETLEILCQQCDNKFKYNIQLKKHIAKKHASVSEHANCVKHSRSAEQGNFRGSSRFEKWSNWSVQYAY